MNDKLSSMFRKKEEYAAIAENNEFHLLKVNYSDIVFIKMSYSAKIDYKYRMISHKCSLSFVRFIRSASLR